MWLSLLLVASVLHSGLGDDNSGDDNSTIVVLELQEIPLEDLNKATVPHPSHVMNNGVEDNYHQKEVDPHGGHGEKEAAIQKKDNDQFESEHGNRKKTLDGERRATRTRTAKESKRRGRFKREVDNFKVTKGNVRHKRFFGTWMLWENGIVPYSFSDGLSGDELKAAKDAMDLIELYTCVKFFEWDGTDEFFVNHGLSHKDSILFVPQGNDGCWSQIGRRKEGQQQLSACSRLLTAIHELGHVLGGLHEHESYDRAGNVEINMGNVKEGMERNFHKHDPAFRSYYNVDSYDIQSLMHYEPYDFTGTGLPTVDPLYRDFAEPAEDYWLFMKEITKVYKCWDNKCGGTDLECKNQGYKAFYNNTCQCVCPMGLDHNHQCNEVVSTTCGGIFNLTKEHPRVEIQSPTIAEYTGHNATCTWLFRTEGKIKLDFVEFSFKGDNSGCDETLRIRRNLLGQSGSVYCGEGFEKSVFSTGNFLALDMVGSPAMTANLLASASAIFSDETCYNWNDRGETYNGDLDRSEDYYQCVDWTEATECNHSPFYYSGELMANYSGNACRNPGGVLHRPWCYTEVRQTSCTIRYCEPCQIGNIFDVYDNCESILRRFPSFCSDPEAYHGCRKTCDIPNYIIARGTCGPPPEYPDATISGADKESYEVGEFVTYSCSVQAKRWCLSTGEWSELNGICGECEDKISDCEMMVMRNHTMCQTSADFSNRYCHATCGFCGTPAVCPVPGPDPESNTVKVTTTSSVPQGELAEYKCMDGMFPNSGDENLVCMSDGELYGEPLVCTPNNIGVMRVSDLEVIQLPFVFFPAWSLMGHNIMTNITRAGAVRTWYFYCVDAGRVILAVFRDTPSGTLIVGLTETECDADRLNIRHLSPLNEIYVDVNDYIGVLDILGGSLTFTTCVDDSSMSHVVNFGDASMFKEDVMFNVAGGYFCSYASVNADIGPIRHANYRIINYHLRAAAPGGLP